MELRCVQIAVIMSVFKACLSSKNNTTIYVCVGEDVILSCPPAGINKTVSWFRRNASKNLIVTLYQGPKGKDKYLPSNIAIDVNKEKGEFNLTIKNLTQDDTGTYQCLHDKDLTSWLFHILMKDCTIKKNDSEPMRTVIPQCSGDVVEDSTIANKSKEPITTVIPKCPEDAVKGILTKNKIIYAMIVVLLVVVLIIVSLFGHAYIRIQYQQNNVPVPQTDVVRHSPVQIEMQEVSNDAEDVQEESRNLHFLSEILQDLQNAASDDKQSDLSKTNTNESSSSLSNRSPNEEDYLHPYHGFVHSRMDVHEYASVGIEYEDITETCKTDRRVYENIKSVN